MVQTRSKAQSRHRLTRSKSNWKPNSTKSTQKTSELDEQEVPIDSIGANSPVIDDFVEPQTDSYSDELESSEDDEFNEPDSEAESTELDQQEGDLDPESMELEQEEIEPEYVQEDVTQTEGLSKEKKVIHFNDKGQPVGEGSASFANELGSIARKHCPVSYRTWRCVPSETKDFLWKLVTDNYVVPAIYKAQILTRMCFCWKRYKGLLRNKYYDAYNRDEERKRNCPTGVAQVVWDKFVDNHSTPAAQILRILGRNARQAMNTVHFSGRYGAARLAEALRKRNPSGTVSRTELYLALHSRADGSCPTPGLAEKLEKIKTIATENPSSINLDVDHDPVAQVCGRERGGRSVRGLGTGVSKISLRHSAIALHHLQQERRLRLAAEKQLADLRGKAGCPEPIDTHSLRGVSKASLRHSAIAIHHLQRERELRITVEKQLSDLREKMVSPEPVETHQGVSPEPVETHQGGSSEPVETHQGVPPEPVELETNYGVSPESVVTHQVVAPEPVETHSSGAQWFQNTPLLRKRKPITEPNKSDYEMGSKCKKRKEFKDDDVGMDLEDEEDAISVSNEDEQGTELMEPDACNVASERVVTGHEDTVPKRKSTSVEQEQSNLEVFSSKNVLKRPRGRPKKVKDTTISNKVSKVDGYDKQPPQPREIADCPVAMYTEEEPDVVMQITGERVVTDHEDTVPKRKSTSVEHEQSNLEVFLSKNVLKRPRGRPKKVKDTTISNKVSKVDGDDKQPPQPREIADCPVAIYTEEEPDVVIQITGDECMTGQTTSHTAQKDNPEPFFARGNESDVNNENSTLKMSVEQNNDLDTAVSALISMKHTGSALSSLEVTPITEKSSSVPMTEMLFDNAYHWAKYGQNDIKGSEFPRSYYRCTYPNCQVIMQLEKSHDGRFKDIVYRGKHDHPKTTNCMPIGAILSLEEDSFNRSSNISDKSSNGHLQTSGLNSIPKGGLGDGDGTPVGKAPKVTVETLSEVDMVDDGYRWRKYGVKMVKGNSHPRNYYRCTDGGCSAKKHVERATNNPRSVVTIYEGKHNHDLPPPRFTINDTSGTIISSREETRDETDNDKDKDRKKTIKVQVSKEGGEKTKSKEAGEKTKSKEEGEKMKNKEEGKKMKSKEDDEKMKMTKVANAAAQVAVGRYDVLSQWRLMAKQARQKRSYSRLMAKQALKKHQGEKSVLPNGGTMIWSQSGVQFQKVW